MQNQEVLQRDRSQTWLSGAIPGEEGAIPEHVTPRARGTNSQPRRIGHFHPTDDDLVLSEQGPRISYVLYASVETVV